MALNDAEFHAWLRTQFSTLDEAKAWARCWFVDRHQELPEWGLYTMRAMAAHVSMALENREYEGWGGFATDYLETKYGAEIYRAMC